ncbi:MAG: TonB-dependent receptor [Pseudomonadota bacterium]
MPKRLLLAGAALSALSGASFAQDTDDPFTLVVQGSRLDQTIADTGAPITILTADDLERQGFPFVIDALASAPGVTVNSTGAFGGAGSVRIRGNGTDQTLVLIDGVPVGDTSSVGGAFDFARLDPAQIERIEIIRGPQSTLWGSEAIGGVVSITTKAADGGVNAFGEAGSFETYRGGASFSGRSDQGSWRLGVSGIGSDGISKADESAGNTEDDGYRSQSISARFDRQVGGVFLDARVFGTSAETEFDSFDFTAPGGVSDGDERTETDELNVSLRASTGSAEGFRQELLIGASQIERRNYANAAPSFSSAGERAIVRYQGTLSNASGSQLAFGAEGDFREAGGDDASILSAFALGNLAVSDGLTITGGLRLDDHDTFGSETTGRIAAAWDIRPGVTLRSSFGQGFRAPSLFQQTFFCCGASSANPDLSPERSEGFDAGVIVSLPRISFDIGLFTQDTDDLIDFSFVDGGYVNIDRVETEGFEFAGTVDILSWLDFSLSYAYTDATDGDGNALARIPEHAGDLTAIIDPYGPFSGQVLVRYNGEEADSFGAVDAWTRVDASIQYRISDQVEVYARGENLFDEDYQQVFGYGTPGRSGFIGVRASY